MFEQVRAPKRWWRRGGADLVSVLFSSLFLQRNCLVSVLFFFSFFAKKLSVRCFFFAKKLSGRCSFFFSFFCKEIVWSVFFFCKEIIWSVFFFSFFAKKLFGRCSFFLQRNYHYLVSVLFLFLQRNYLVSVFFTKGMHSLPVYFLLDIRYSLRL